ncbi:D-alanyl-D-alanine carboxypeptidase family protein [Lutispora thermophila]|uniref:D-alanyl-D-alanine carboxypeptidase (Penicillin-binding protein 5/6) n=1 Tax=Lutispora thermophila DSM 19022 TaxID=1122184 RepID=A0A1M6IJ64_9FIRM|nr:D-alanyl-D-alanine carboxypeptidase [Lutispora thermophila]SHJ34459.1 D-alanyl-D-alanine carboxypeptidase (penicillin-binding protein 5/6) [Lutispora thermophila DSM 19022]
MVRKSIKKKSGIGVSVTLLIMVAIATVICSYIMNLGNRNIVKREYYDEISPYSFFSKIKYYITGDRIISFSPSKTKLDFSVSTSFEGLHSPNAILIHLKDHAVIMEKKSEERIYPASLTKMMTVIVAIENLHDINEKVELTNFMFQGLYEANASMAGFQPGEQVRAIDLLYGVMLPSGAECCIAIAEHIAGSERNFVKLMNQKAEELGMKNTHFENTTGLHNEKHYTTVKDLAVLLSYALKNDTFREIFTTFRYSTPPTNRHPDGITFYSTMYERLGDQNIINGEILGGKTGYTDKAGLCLASLAKVDKQEYILITAGAKGNHHSEQYNITDALTVYNSIRR